MLLRDSNCLIFWPPSIPVDQGEPGVDYNDTNLNPLVCDICKRNFDSLDKLGEHQKVEHDM